jgi:hypothetical protein
MKLDEYLSHGHHYSCLAYARKGDPKYPCSCGYDQALIELEAFKTRIDTKRIRLIIGTAILYDEKQRFDGWSGQDAKKWVNNIVKAIINPDHNPSEA